MEFRCPVIAVRDLEKTKKFYQEVLKQKITLDLGWNVTFQGDFAVQYHFDQIMCVDKNSIVQKSHNFELYFEEEDFESFKEHLKHFPDIAYVHDEKTYPWGQRVIRIYDPDGHIVEIGESMSSVAKRLLAAGLSIAETAERIMHPVEFVEQIVKK